MTDTLAPLQELMVRHCSNSAAKLDERPHGESDDILKKSYSFIAAYSQAVRHVHAFCPALTYVLQWSYSWDVKRNVFFILRWLLMCLFYSVKYLTGVKVCSVYFCLLIWRILKLQ